MIVITPITVNDAILTTSNVAEPYAGEVAWVAATSYVLGQEVIRSTTHKKYKNILAGADAGLPENTPLRWTESGVTNKYAMFDQLRSTQTSVPSPLTVTVTPGKRINSFSAIGLVGETITLTMTQGGTTIYSYTQNLSTRIVKNYYDYCYAEFGNMPAIAKFDLPPASNGVITFSLSSATGTVKCGGLIIGNQTYLGQLQYGAKIGSRNFSTIDRAFDGTATLIPRPSKPTVNGRLFSDVSITEKVLAIKAQLDGVPAVFSGLDDKTTDARFSGLLISGLLRSLEPSLDYPSTNMVEIEVEEI